MGGGFTWWHGLRSVAVATLCLLFAVGASAAQTIGERPDPRTASAALVMIEDPGCPYCARWRAEVGPGYARSDEGRYAPLVRRQRGDPSISFIANVVYSPTFVLLVEGREIGRILGYPGPDLFWMQLAGLFQRTSFKGAASPSSAPAEALPSERRS